MTITKTISEKICSGKNGCGKMLKVCDFDIQSMSKLGFPVYHSCCRKCRSKINMEWSRNNPEKHRAGSKRWNDAHPERVRENRKKWNDAHPDYKKEWKKNERENNPLCRATKRLSAFYRGNLNRHLDGKPVYKHSKYYDILNITAEDLETFFATIFSDGCSVCKQPLGDTDLNLHHVLSHYSATTEEGVIELNALSNLVVIHKICHDEIHSH